MLVMEEHWLTIDQLLALAAAEGFQTPEITTRKIERWRKARLLPHPRLIRLGRKGTRSEYPPETGRQLLALCRLRRRFPHDLDAIRFRLWYERYSLSIDDVKQSMEQLLTPLLRTLPLDTSDSLSAAEELASQARSKRIRSSSGRRRLKQLRNTSEVDTVLTAIFQLMLGDVPGFTAHAEEELGERPLAELFLDVLGLNRAQTDRIGEVKPWLPQDNNEIARQLEGMAEGQFLSLPALLQTLKDADTKQLAQARADLVRLLPGFKRTAKAMEGMFGPNAFGFGLFRELPNDPAFLVLFLSLLVRLRTTPHSTGIDEIKATLQNSKPDYQRTLAFLKALRQEQSAIAEEILTQAQELDLSDVHAFEQLHTIFAAAYAKHAGELQAFFQRHPELIPPDEGM